MSELAARLMTIDEFLSWQDLQEVRCELVDGRPVAMTGASFAHDRVVGNLRWALKNQLRAAGSQCESFGADIGLTIDPWTLRRPDVAVYCPPFDESAARSNRPRLLAEVLSRSTEQLDYFTKMDEYKAVAALRTIWLVDPRAVAVGVWTRDSAGEWQHRVVRDIGATLHTPDLGIEVALNDIYDLVTIDTAATSPVPLPGSPPQR